MFQSHACKTECQPKLLQMYHFPFVATSPTIKHDRHTYFSLINPDFHLYMIIATAGQLQAELHSLT